MLRLGIVGAENSHAAGVARQCNVDKTVKGVRVTHIWGEKRSFAEKTAEAGDIETIVKTPTDMIGEIDCVMVDHRDTKYHIPAATPFVEAGVPTFVDKPLSAKLSEAKRFLELRSELDVPVTSFSAVPLQKSVKKHKKALRDLGPIRTLAVHGPADYRSKYGGVVFYACHAVETLVELMAPEVKQVVATTNKPNCAAVLTCADGLTVTLNFHDGGPGVWALSAVGENGLHQGPIDFQGGEIATKTFVKMFKTGKEPYDDRRLLAPVAILEAMAKSVDRKKPVKVGSYSNL